MALDEFTMARTMRVLNDQTESSIGHASQLMKFGKPYSEIATAFIDAETLLFKNVTCMVRLDAKAVEGVGLTLSYISRLNEPWLVGGEPPNVFATVLIERTETPATIEYLQSPLEMFNDYWGARYLNAVAPLTPLGFIPVFALEALTGNDRKGYRIISREEGPGDTLFKLVISGDGFTLTLEYNHSVIVADVELMERELGPHVKS